MRHILTESHLQPTNVGYFLPTPNNLKMENFSLFQNQLIFPEYDAGLSDGIFENYSSGDSNHSGDFPRSFLPYSSPTSNSDGANISGNSPFSNGGFASRDSPVFNGDTAFEEETGFIDYLQSMSLDKRPIGYDRPRFLRNESVTSPSPKQVSSIVKPFLHVGPPSPWQLQGRGRRNSTSSHGQADWSNFALDPRSSGNRYRDDPMMFTSSEMYPAQSAASSQRPRYCNHPQCQVDDDFDNDTMAMAYKNRVMSNPPLNNRQSRRLSNMEDSRDQEPGLKHRLGQVRAMIREDLARRAAEDEARGVYPSSRRDRKGKKKCKFCLKKKEPADIVGHHNVMNEAGEVTCPILQQYRCDVCHATGKRAHTIKYCPLNNPSIPHEIILHARWQVHQRNKQRE